MFINLSELPFLYVYLATSLKVNEFSYRCSMSLRLPIDEFTCWGLNAFIGASLPAEELYSVLTRWLFDDLKLQRVCVSYCFDDLKFQ